MDFQYDTTLEDLIDHLRFLLSRQFSNDIAAVYFGDIGIYLPSTFGSSRRDQKAVVAINPVSSTLHDDNKTWEYEYRDLLLHIIVLVNITSDFRASPEEAYGERLLARLTTQIHQYLTHERNVDLDGRVQYTSVGDIDWDWQQRDDQSLRGAALEYTARVIMPHL